MKCAENAVHKTHRGPDCGGGLRIHRYCKAEVHWVGWCVQVPAGACSYRNAVGRARLSGALRPLSRGWPYAQRLFPASAMTDEHDTDNDHAIQEPRLWSDGRWTARVVKNEDDDGWAVAMTLRSESEPALVGPWTMGRDKKNPKPLDVNAFHTLVKTANEVLRRHEQQLHAQLNKSLHITVQDQRLRIALAIVPDEDGATATLSAQDVFGQELARVPVPPTFKLNQASATAWAESGFERPR